MKHPTPEQWMDWLYHELEPEQHHELEAHLAMCEDCRQHVETWRQTLGALDEWKVEAPKPAPRKVVPLFVRWAAAAAIVLGLGIGIGRLTAPVVDTAALKTELREQMSRDLQQQLAGMRSEFDKAREEDHGTFAAALEEMESAQAATDKRLREDLETVAVAAENRIYNTERQIVQLVRLNTAGNSETTERQ